MEDLEKIIEATSEVFGLSKSEIINGREQKAEWARHILAHIAVRDYCISLKKLAATFNRPRNQWNIMLYEYNNLIESDTVEDVRKGEGFINMFNAVRNRLGKSSVITKQMTEADLQDITLKREMKSMRNKTNAQCLFGIEYDAKEENGMRKLMAEATDYMRDLCRIGLQNTNRIVRHAY